MSVTYTFVQRINPHEPEAPKKFYPSIQSTGRVTTRELAEMAAQRSTISTMDVMAVIEALLAIIPEQMVKGNIVELGDFGNFWLRAETTGVDTEEEANVDQIERVKARFRPAKQFKKLLIGIGFVRKKVPPVVPPEPEPAPQP